MSAQTKTDRAPKARRRISGTGTFHKARIEVAGIPPKPVTHGRVCAP